MKRKNQTSGPVSDTLVSVQRFTSTNVLRTQWMKLVDKMNFKAKNCSLSCIFFERILHVKKPMHIWQQPYVLGLWISGRLFYICTSLRGRRWKAVERGRAGEGKARDARAEQEGREKVAFPHLVPATQSIRARALLKDRRPVFEKLVPFSRLRKLHCHSIYEHSQPASGNYTKLGSFTLHCAVSGRTSFLR